MKNLNLKYLSLIFIFFVLSMPNFSRAAISFTDGKWETTFKCPNEWQGGDGAIICSDGVFNRYLDGACIGTTGDKLVQIVNVANYSSGGGGMGMRQWYGNGKNNKSGGIGITFPSAQSEVWMRWYQRADAGLQDGLNQGETKTLYFKHGDSLNALSFGLIGTDQWRFWLVATDSSTPISIEGYGWASLISQKNWEAVEVHIKADTNNSNGVLQAWVNSTLIMNITNADTAPTSAGWTGIEFPSNHDIFTNEACAPIDHDDVVIYNLTPPGRDASNNPFIGPIGWVNAGDEIAPGSPTGLSIL
ncbi:MAG: hypothetical protein V3574_05275 [Candidatus Moraniibacteriota bacterium]